LLGSIDIQGTGEQTVIPEQERRILDALRQRKRRRGGAIHPRGAGGDIKYSDQKTGEREEDKKNKEESKDYF
jgi:hypothetical protein